MPRRCAALVLALAAALASVGGHAADTAAPPPPQAVAPTPPRIAPNEADATPSPRAGEPAIKRTVVEDRTARIEELRVRGQLQHVVVDPKGGVPGYEILLGDGSHAIGDDPGTSRGSAGKRVWNVLRF